MIIMGIDPGLTATGFGLISINKDKPKIIDFGIIQPNKNESLSKRLHTIYTDMEQLIQTFSPTVLSIEDVFYGRNVKSALLLGQARGVLLLAAASMEIPSASYAPRKVKQSVAGNGAADKKQVQYMVQQILNMDKPPKPLDVSDALAVALCHINQNKYL